MSRTNFDMLLQAGCHFGHLRRKWNPAMAPYIYTERNGIHIIDLHKTVAKIDEAAEALKQIAKSGKKILVVATKKQTKEIVAEKVCKRKYALRHRTLAWRHAHQLPYHPQGGQEDDHYRQDGERRHV